jgi:cell division protein FtsW
MNILRVLFPFFDPDVQNWSTEARLLRWLTCLWVVVGLIALFSASYPVADSEHQDGLYYVKRQLIWTWFGLIGFNAIVRYPLKKILKIAGWMLFLTMGLLMLTLVGFGSTVNGATRWISLGPILLQPSELMKPFLVLQAAAVFGKWNQLSFKFRSIWLMIFAIALAEILMQPNLSTTALCGITLWLMATASGIRWRNLIGVAILGVMTAGLSISVKTYQRRRILSFMNPWEDARGDGYQLVQSLLAVGSGRFTGMGYGLSQQKLFYLPIQYTDFIFSVFAEEFGFVGCSLFLLMILFYGTVAMVVAMKCNTLIYRLIAVGAMVIIVGQSIINIGVATGVFPTTGLPLPLFSYGGSSSLASLFLAGLIIRVARESSEAAIVNFKSQAS